MRAAPPLLLSVSRYGAWRLFETLLAAATAAALAAWIASTAFQAAAWPWASAAGLLVAAVTSRGSGRAPAIVQWDGRSWRVGPASAPDVAELPSGRLRATLDLGSLLLLRFEPDNGGPALWLPLQRRGLEAHWHALRCAVYSPRPSPAPASVDAPPPPA